MLISQTEELKAERKMIPPAVYRMDAPEDLATPVHVKWNRLVSMQKIVRTHALTGSITHYLEDLRVEKEDKAYQEYVKTAAQKPTDVKKSEEKKTNRVNTIWGYGSPLTRSDRGPFNKTPDLCTHPLSRTIPG
eukprot:3771053-Karenia_brevis.AAC.1